VGSEASVAKNRAVGATFLVARNCAHRVAETEFQANGRDFENRLPLASYHCILVSSSDVEIGKAVMTTA
jgi:hypothetical protein